MMIFKETKMRKFIENVGWCMQMYYVLKESTIKELGEENCRLTVLYNLDKCPLSKFRRWRIKKYLNKSSFDRGLLQKYLIQTQKYYYERLKSDYGDYLPGIDIEIRVFYEDKLPIYLSEKGVNIDYYTLKMMLATKDPYVALGEVWVILMDSLKQIDVALLDCLQRRPGGSIWIYLQEPPFMDDFKSYKGEYCLIKWVDQQLILDVPRKITSIEGKKHLQEVQDILEPYMLVLNRKLI